MEKFSRKKIIISSILLFLFIVVTMIMLFDKERVIDEAIYNLIISCRCDFFDSFFTYITRFCNTKFVIVFVSLFMLFYRKIEGIFLSISAMDSALMTLGFKHIFVRPRPEHLRLIEQGGYSFPSGHSMISVCVYGYLLYLALIKIKNKYLKYFLVTILSLLIICVGISRIYVGVHYPTDVMAGYLLGAIEVILLTEVLRLYKIRGN